MTDLDRALRELAAGSPIVMPTDTVYGIAVLPTADAVVRVFEVKGRPQDKPLPVLGAALESFAGIAEIDRRARIVAERFWPGPLTLVVPRAAGFEVDLGGTDDTVAVRVPAHQVAQELLQRAGPLAVTSANRSGEPPATTVLEARAALPDVGVFVDGGRCDGAPSTVLTLVGEAKVLRAGPLDEAELLQAATS